ncbi:universal stress protein UspA (plasmid) [Rhodococcus opacus]|uniref:Universal stress protein UspA n=1 Tax=Rhodococcus opacus TaxID=37919 RepID=A0A1B1KHE7_RHOOP|nr:universal stress protein [Rhodococcus opacus]ANS32036.1 universal stress protein UspA [Rhodococcus opacus]
MSVSAIVGYDGSRRASAAIDSGAALFPAAHGWITHLWTPPFADATIRRRLLSRARDANELTEMVEREGRREAERLVAMGVTLARAAGWDAEPLLKKTLGAEGLSIARSAEELHADLVLVGSRGLGGTRALLGSVSDMVVHYSAKPVVVVPYPMLAAEYDALNGGPVVVGWDGSAGAETAIAATAHLFPDREVLPVCVDEGFTPPEAPANVGGREVLRCNSQRSPALHGRGIADALVTAANAHDAAAVVVGSRGRSATREILLGSVAMATLHHCHRPVMVVPSRSEAPIDE